MPDGMEKAGVGRRGTQRLRLIAEGRLITRAGYQRVKIENISQTGAQLAVTGGQPFTWCILRFADREIDGEFAWSEPGHCGIVFIAPLSDEDILAMKRQYPDIDENSRLPAPGLFKRI